MKHINFESAQVLNKLGFDEYTEDLYMNTPIGIKGVKSKDGETVAERTWHTGDLCQRDKEWEVEYPSPNWIPAPTVFETVDWLEKHLGIIIEPGYNRDNKDWYFDIIYSSKFAQTLGDNPRSFNMTWNTLENCFEYAVNYICHIAKTNNWKTKMSDYINNLK